MKPAPLIYGILLCFFLNSVGPVPLAGAAQAVVPFMPQPGAMVNLSPAFTPAHLKGIVIHPDNPLQFDFLIHRGDGNLSGEEKKQEYNRLVKYFLASLTVPDKDQWVNLSPYEKERIIEDSFGKTEMGRDLLAQDYLLKQITSSLMYPESGLGKDFWDKVYQRAWKEYGTTDIPVNTFNKVWIMPDQAVVYESGNTAYIAKSHLKVMLEEDYLALNKNNKNSTHSVTSKIIREVILPELEKEVNEGKNFAMLRQVFSGMILATWYKKALKESLLGKVYADKAKVAGVIPAKAGIHNEEIYQQYLSAFKKGVYNYIKDDFDQYSRQTIPRKYFAGGFGKDMAMMRTEKVNPEVLTKAMKPEDLDAAQVAADPALKNTRGLMELLKDFKEAQPSQARDISNEAKNLPPSEQARFYTEILYTDVEDYMLWGNDGVRSLLLTYPEVFSQTSRWNGESISIGERVKRRISHHEIDLPDRVIKPKNRVYESVRRKFVNTLIFMRTDRTQLERAVRDLKRQQRWPSVIRTAIAAWGGRKIGTADLKTKVRVMLSREIFAEYRLATGKNVMPSREYNAQFSTALDNFLGEGDAAMIDVADPRISAINRAIQAKREALDQFEIYINWQTK